MRNRKFAAFAASSLLALSLGAPAHAQETTIAQPELPQRIGRYEVRSRLGEGATSEVFLARDDFHDRLVAIKRVRHATLANPLDVHYSSGVRRSKEVKVAGTNIRDILDDQLPKIE